MGCIIINEERCKGCQLCTENCPHRLIAVAEHTNSMGYHPVCFSDEQSLCNGCTLCAICCPDLAIEVYR